MDREKLEKSSDDFAHSIPDIGGGGDYTIWHVMDAFEQGAEWLMQQPISERLTEDEIAKARAAYRRAEEGCNGHDDVEYAVGRVVKTVLNEIFGADLFK